MAPLDTDRSDPAVLCSIPASVDLLDRADLYDALEALPEQDRTDVTLFAGDRIVRNLPSDGDVAFFYTSTATPGLFVDPSGQETLFPEEAQRATQSTCGVGGCTGLLHKLSAAPGYSYFFATVSIPCASSQLSLKGKQGGFIYTGGTSDTGKGLDVGIQLNAPVSDSPAPPTSIQMFYTYNHVSGGDKINSHFVCDTTATLKFYTAQARAGAKAFPTLVFTGTFTSGGAPTRTYLVKTVKADGWSQLCTNCTVKRVTSIAVPQNQSPQTSLQTWLGVTSPFSSSPKPTVQWSSCTQGKFTTYGRQATPQTTLWTSTAFQDDPSDGQTKGVILAQPSGPANELVGINESGPRLQISDHGNR